MSSVEIIFSAEKLGKSNHAQLKIWPLYSENNKLFEDKSVLELRFSKAANDVMSILQHALAGYEDDYKIIINGTKYTQWGKVERDIRKLLEVEK
jgi:hypothetical protein